MAPDDVVDVTISEGVEAVDIVAVLPPVTQIEVTTPEESSVIEIIPPTDEAVEVDLVDVLVPGPPGPPGADSTVPGPPGPPGPAGGAFRFVQMTPATTWTIVHNLDFFPNVTVLDSSHQVVIPDVSYPDASTVVLLFSAAVAGEAYLS